MTNHLQVDMQILRASKHLFIYTADLSNLLLNFGDEKGKVTGRSDFILVTDIHISLRLI